MSAFDLIHETTQAEIRKPEGVRKPGLREDLLMILPAEAAGWTVSFRNNSWHNGADFKKGDIVVWSTGRDWRRDVVTGGRGTGKPEVFPHDMGGLRTALNMD